MYAVYLCGDLHATVKGDDEDHGIPLPPQLPRLGATRRGRQRLRRLGRHRDVDRRGGDRRRHHRLRHRLDAGCRPPLPRDRRPGPARRLDPLRPHARPRLQGRATAARPSAASARSTWRSGTSRPRTPASPSGGCSAAPTASSPGTHPASTSPSTTRPSPPSTSAWPSAASRAASSRAAGMSRPTSAGWGSCATPWPATPPSRVSCSTPTRAGTSSRPSATSPRWRPNTTWRGSRSLFVDGMLPATPGSPVRSAPPWRRART